MIPLLNSHSKSYSCLYAFKDLLTGLLDPQKFEETNLRGMGKAAKAKHTSH